MKVQQHLFFILIFISMGRLSAQDLSKHRWKNRVLLVLTETTNQQLLQAQLNEWRAHAQGLQERKLVVYQVRPQSFRVGLSKTSALQPNLPFIQATSDPQLLLKYY